MAATVEVTLVWIFSLPREVVSQVLSGRGRSLTVPDKKDHVSVSKALNGDRAIVAMIYYNEGKVFPEEEQTIIADPNFYESMSLSPSLDEGLSRLDTRKKLTSVLQDKIKIKDLSDVVMSFFTPEEAYIHNIVSPNPTLAKLSSDVTIQRAYIYAVETGWYDGVKILESSREITQSILEAAFGHMSQLGNIPVMEWLISKGAKDVNGALERAAMGGHISAMEWLAAEPRGANHWSRALIGAANGGHIPALEWVFLKDPHTIFLDSALVEAARNGHIPAMEWLAAAPRGANAWNTALVEAARNGHIRVMEWLASKGANDWDNAMLVANSKDNIAVMEWLMTKPVSPELWNVLMAEAASKSNITLMQWLSDRGIYDLDIVLPHASHVARNWLNAKINQRS